MMMMQQPTVVIQQPVGHTGHLGPVTNLEGTRTWSSELFDLCGEDTSCFINNCCPCITWYYISQRLHENPCVPFCVPGAIINFRTRIRTLGSIKGNICGDCVTLACCHGCALGQMERELKTMGW